MTFAANPRNTLSGLKSVYRLYARFVSDADRRLARLRRSPTERRILIELGYNPHLTDVRLAKALGIDRSQLSRSVTRLIEAGLVIHESNPDHAAQRLLSLSTSGEECAAHLDAAWSQAIGEQIGDLPERELSHVMRAAGALIDDPTSGNTPYEIEIEPLCQNALVWMLGRASGLHEMGHLAAAVSRYIRREQERIGFSARHFRQTVGTCMIVVKEDDITGVVEGLTVDAAFRAAGADHRLMAACIDKAKEITLLRVVAHASADDRHQDRLFRQSGFKRIRGVFETNRTGIVEQFRKYELSLPVPR
jgi:DNA-binding MarR family transcriptional regulator/N-acetylglutamate synthase-like GNAT family acetyltransferase